MTARRTAAALLLAVGVVGAGLWRHRNREDKSGTREATQSESRTVPGATSEAVPRDTVAAVPIQWTVAEALARLRAAGMQPAIRGEIRQPFLAVPGAVIRLESAEIQVYLYGDAGAAGRDVARLDTSRVAPPEMMITWIAPPSLIWHNNLLAIVLTRDAGLRARIRLALEPRREIGESP